MLSDPKSKGMKIALKESSKTLQIMKNSRTELY